MNSHILNIEFIDEENSATLHIAEGMIRDLAGNELRSSVSVSFTYSMLFVSIYDMYR